MGGSSLTLDRGVGPQCVTPSILKPAGFGCAAPGRQRAVPPFPPSFWESEDLVPAAGLGQIKRLGCLLALLEASSLETGGTLYSSDLCTGSVLSQGLRWPSPERLTHDLFQREGGSECRLEKGV